ncbi:hypothetical protein LTR17_013462 [Elasticomyces elasticus]|nr:hypothetical protein LTR17_013462 [Elasticomyces elasticus]
MAVEHTGEAIRRLAMTFLVAWHDPKGSTTTTCMLCCLGIPATPNRPRAHILRFATLMRWKPSERRTGSVYVSLEWRLCDAVSEVFDPTLLPDLLAGFDSEIVDLFASFLSDIHYDNSSEDMSAYQIPYGRLNADILHFLHWPLETPGQPRRWSSSSFSAHTLRVSTAIFPNFQTNALFHDYFCKRVLVNRPDGTRKTNSEIYDYHIPKHQRFSRLLFEKSSAELIVVWGGPARRWFKKEFNVEDGEKYGSVDGVVIGEKPASVTLNLDSGSS